MLVNCAFTAGLLFYGKRRKNLLISATAAAVALQVGFFYRPGPVQATKQAVLVQENAPILNSVWPEDLYQRTLQDWVQISLQAVPRTPSANLGLIIWPESPAPLVATDPRLRSVLASLAQSANSYLIVGSSAFTETRDEKGNPQLLNSALVVDPQGNVLGRYDKMHLVPFGEYVPLKRLLFFADKLTREVGDFARGTDRKVFDLNGTKRGVFFSYDPVFPDKVRDFPATAARFFVNIPAAGC